MEQQGRRFLHGRFRLGLRVQHEGPAPAAAEPQAPSGSVACLLPGRAHRNAYIPGSFQGPCPDRREVFDFLNRRVQPDAASPVVHSAAAVNGLLVSRPIMRFHRSPATTRRGPIIHLSFQLCNSRETSPAVRTAAAGFMKSNIPRRFGHGQRAGLKLESLKSQRCCR